VLWARSRPGELGHAAAKLDVQLGSALEHLTIPVVPSAVVAGQQAVVGDEAIGIGGEPATERGIANQTV
jgi:hypothetical protein